MFDIFNNWTVCLIFMCNVSPFQCGTDFRCQIPTSEVDPHTELINIY